MDGAIQAGPSEPEALSPAKRRLILQHNFGQPIRRGPRPPDEIFRHNRKAIKKARRRGEATVKILIAVPRRPQASSSR
jgi:hypothetical protein